MNLLKKIALTAIMALAMVTAALGPAQAFVCTEMCYFPQCGVPTCVTYAPSAPSGWTSTGGDNTCYAGEAVICSGTNKTGHCFYKSFSPGVVTGQPAFYDMDSYPISSGTGTPGFKIRSLCTNFSGTGWFNLFNDQNYNGYTHVGGAGAQTINDFTSFQVSSANFKN